jgi:hypothetical protein
MAIVYEHIRNDTNEVFYVGMGEEEKRAFSKHGRNPHWKNIVNKVGYTVNIVYKDIEHKEAKKIEILLIEKYGRKNLGIGNLVNMTDGGEGALGHIVSDDIRQKLSEAGKGKKQSSETIAKRVEKTLGKTRSKEARQKMSEGSKCRKGVKGYYFHNASKKWRAQIKVRGKAIYLGAFDTPEEASKAYQQARLIYFV